MDPQESSPTPEFKSVNFSALSFLQGPTLTSYMTTGKTIALTRWTFICKVMSLLFNMLSKPLDYSKLSGITHGKGGNSHSFSGKARGGTEKSH